jgi:leucyl aminopeptidase
MQVQYSAGPATEISADVLILFTTKTEKLTDKHLKEIDAAVGGGLRRLIESGEFTGKNGQIASFFNPLGFRCGRLLVVGLGESDKLVADSFRKAVGIASRNDAMRHSRSAAVHFGKYSTPGYAQAVAEGYLLGSYEHRDYKTGDDNGKERGPKTMLYAVDKMQSLKPMQQAAGRGQIIAEGQLLARRLAWTPANDLTPSIYARKAQQLAQEHGFKCKVLDEKAIAKEKMGAFLSVARGSEEPPRFMILELSNGRAGQKPIVLVGKGVTFDSGGISLKPGQDMHEMKQDMAGSAVVLATFVTAARLGLKLNLVGLIPATENMPSGRATRPGDVIKSRKGKTIEIINTDAEGRLILADALDYANQYDPQAVIDIATLTGAALYVLGYAGAPIMGNDDKLLNLINDAGDETGERVWPLPIWDDMRDQMKSKIADLANSGGKPSGTIAAAAFLENFIGDWPWAHIDIAYVDMEPKGRPYIPAGATGFGVRLFVELLSNWKKL